MEPCKGDTPKPASPLQLTGLKLDPVLNPGFRSPQVDAQRLMERMIAGHERFVTDAEVLQEILHRYAAIGRHDAIQPAFATLLGLVDDVFPVSANTVHRAKEIVLGGAG